MSLPRELTGSVFRILHLPDRDDGRGAAFFFDDATIAWLGAVAEIHVVAIAPGQVRGNHRHAARREVLFVHHDGAIDVAWRDPHGVDTGQVRLEGPGGFIVRVEPATLHALRNAATGRVEVVSLSNGRFDPSETAYETLLTPLPPEPEGLT